ncbi:hypothetical protein DENSPDRAFT_884418 [Dentipellis sp. KUC8613]|nr:hypothetical protein DENSPDRAFT_884418 [Dentipellis sp. KUC8613]
MCPSGAVTPQQHLRTPSHAVALPPGGLARRRLLRRLAALAYPGVAVTRGAVTRRRRNVVVHPCHHSALLHPCYAPSRHCCTPSHTPAAPSCGLWPRAALAHHLAPPCSLSYALLHGPLKPVVPTSYVLVCRRALMPLSPARISCHRPASIAPWRPACAPYSRCTCRPCHVCTVLATYVPYAPPLTRPRCYRGPRAVLAPFTPSSRPLPPLHTLRTPFARRPHALLCLSTSHPRPRRCHSFAAILDRPPPPPRAPVHPTATLVPHRRLLVPHCGLCTPPAAVARSPPPPCAPVHPSAALSRASASHGCPRRRRSSTTAVAGPPLPSLAHGHPRPPTTSSRAGASLRRSLARQRVPRPSSPSLRARRRRRSSATILARPPPPPPAPVHPTAVFARPQRYPCAPARTSPRPPRALLAPFALSAPSAALSAPSVRRTHPPLHAYTGSFVFLL